MRSATSRRSVRGLAALVLAGCCAGALAVAPSTSPVAAPAAPPAPATPPTAVAALSPGLPGVHSRAAEAIRVAGETAADSPVADNPVADKPVADSPVPDNPIAEVPVDPAVLEARSRALADSASRSERLLAAQAPAARKVTLRRAGRTTTAWTRVGTVAEVLAQLHVRLRAHDVVSPALSRAPGRAITVTRVVGKQRTTRVRIAFATARVADASLLKGHEAVARAGKAGVRTRVWRLTYRDGKLAARTLLASTVTTKPVTQVVHYGTRVPKPVPSVGGGGYPNFGGLNWHALAKCESGNDPHSHDGPYHGLYQFLLGTWQSVGGSGDPADASIDEQTHRAWLLYQREGRHPWPVCGKYL